MSEQTQTLEEKIKDEIRISKSFLNQKREEINKIHLVIKYYEGQIDALNLILTSIETDKKAN